MSVITLSRQYGSGGRDVARLLCERLGYRYFDRTLMAQLGAQLGVAPEAIVDLSEHRHQVQGLLERVFTAAIDPFGDPGAWALPAQREAQQRTSAQTFQSLVLAAHEHGDVVIMGRGGQVALRGAPDALHVRLVAPVEQRVRRVQWREGLDIDAARVRIVERDDASLDYVRRYYNAEVDDPLLYDLVVNMHQLTPAAAADLIVAALERLQAR